MSKISITHFEKDINEICKICDSNCNTSRPYIFCFSSLFSMDKPNRQRIIDIMIDTYNKGNLMLGRDSDLFHLCPRNEFIDRLTFMEAFMKDFGGTN